MNSVYKALVVLSALTLSACSSFYSDDGFIKDTRFDYLNAKQSKPLKMPASLSQKDKVDYSSVPALSSKAKQAPVGMDIDYSSPVQVLAVMDNVREDKNAENPAVFIQEDKAYLWQIVVELFEFNGVKPALKDEANFVLNTGWLALEESGVWLGFENSKAVDEYKAQYQFAIKPGVQKGEFQLEVQRTAAQRLNDETGRWEALPVSWNDSAEMLNYLLAYYDGIVKLRDVQKRSQAMAGFAVELGADAEGNAALLTDTKMELVWEKLPKVLAELGIEPNDRDRSLMTYFFRYEEEESGFFASLFDEEKQQLPLEFGNYQVSLTPKGEFTAITFKNDLGEPLDASLMTRFYPALSQLFGEKR